jgi:uncharacterized damage-inducible protein DinB
MDLIKHFEQLFAYDAWANREVLGVLQNVSAPPARALKLLAHILSAERLWWERMEQRGQTLPVWPDLTVQQCKAEIAAMEKRWKEFLGEKDEADLAQATEYKNSKGESWKSRKDDILMHVITHSAYHRGQIASDLRAAGIAPAYTDFIHAVRQGWLEEHHE